MKIVQPSIRLLWATTNPEQAVEEAGRTCYKSEDRITLDSAKAFCQKMVKSGHHAMIEHASASFKFVTDRGITHEIVRHRIASYAQESTRYCNYSKDKFDNELSFIQPPELNLGQMDIWEESCVNAEDAYLQMLQQGCSPQIVRSVLPNCLKTEIVMTCNFREWRHFCELRGSLAAHPQIRPIARGVLEILRGIAPSIFKDIILPEEKTNDSSSK